MSARRTRSTSCFQALAEQGKAVIVISSELPEVLRLSHRIAVMCEGRLRRQRYSRCDRCDEQHRRCRVCCRQNAELIGGEGKIAVVAHDQTSRTGIDRRDGFVSKIKEAYPKIEIVTVQYGCGDQLQSTEITKSIPQGNPDIKGIFGTNEGSAIGVVNGVKELGLKVVIIGFDSGALQKAAIEDDTLAGAITQNPVGIGYKTVEAALKAAKGEAVEKNIETGFYWYDKSNIDNPEIAAVLYD